MKVLAIDTGSGTSVAAGELSNDEFVLHAFVEFEDQFGHAENIGTAIRETLTKAGWQSETQLLLAANHGPAGYTGLRVGLAAATAYGATRKLSVLGVSSLAAAAFGFFANNPSVTECTVALEAKRRELFFQTFRRDANSVPVSTSVASLLPLVELPDPLPTNWVNQTADAKSIAELGARLWQQNPIVSQLSAQYLRQPDVTPGSGKRVSG
jgi:tRNA threonylcarbamoyl adenosine modification protein YeaZ